MQRPEEAEITFERQSPEEFTTFIREIAPPITAMMLCTSRRDRTRP
jgi:hypothetical protein